MQLFNKEKVNIKILFFILLQDKDEGNNNERQEKTVSRVFSNFADTTSIQGVPFINNAKNCTGRAIWSCFFIFAFMMLTWQMVGIFQRYFDFPLTTNVEMRRGVLDFPSVTLCNLNPVRMNKLNLDEDLYSYVEKVTNAYIKFSEMGEEMVIHENDSNNNLINIVTFGHNDTFH